MTDKGGDNLIILVQRMARSYLTSCGWMGAEASPLRAENENSLKASSIVMIHNTKVNNIFIKYACTLRGQTKLRKWTNLKQYMLHNKSHVHFLENSRPPVHHTKSCIVTSTEWVSPHHLSGKDNCQCVMGVPHQQEIRDSPSCFNIVYSYHRYLVMLDQNKSQKTLSWINKKWGDDENPITPPHLWSYIYYFSIYVVHNLLLSQTNLCWEITCLQRWSSNTHKAHMQTLAIWHKLSYCQSA